jgi:hypothetical protein
LTAAELALVTIPAAAAGFGGFAAARLRHTRSSGRHPGFAAGYPRRSDSEPEARWPEPWPPPARTRRPARSRWTAVTAVTAVTAWTVLTAYAHMTGYGPLVIALAAAVLVRRFTRRRA